jgi:hypothetical protein
VFGTKPNCIYGLGSGLRPHFDLSSIPIVAKSFERKRKARVFKHRSLPAPKKKGKRHAPRLPVCEAPNQSMVKVNVIGWAAIEPFAESTAVIIPVYVPFGGLIAGEVPPPPELLELLPPPQAEMLNAAAAITSRAAIFLRHLERRPKKPTRSKQANAAVAGSGFSLVLFVDFLGAFKLSACMPDLAIAAVVAQSEALVSRTRLIVAAFVPLTARVPYPDELVVEKPPQRF